MGPTPLLVLLPLLCAIGRTQPTATAVTEYYIAAVEIGWDYVHLDDVDPVSDQRKRLKDAPQKYIKAVYREYTDSTYTVPKPRPAWTGIQGPVIVAQAGDRVVVHFKNLASQPFSISPVGITYWKQSEGAGYDDSTAGQEKEDDAVSPGGYYKYVWDINPNDGPTNSDPECLTYSYSSQVDTVRDINSGLIGALLICKASAFKDKQRRNQAFVLLFAVFDETKSWYGEIGERRSREKFKRSNRRKEYHTINGYINSTLPGLVLCQGRKHVFWHMIGIGTAPEIHSIQFQDHTLQVLAHRKVNVEVTPMAFITAEMKANAIGRFLISCQIFAHRLDGMDAFFMVEQCPSGPDLRNAQQEDYNYEEYESSFNLVSFPPKNPQVQIRSSRGELSKTWEHFIAAEEVTWDYTPHLKHTDSKLQSEYLATAPHHLEYKYKKVAYVEYTDATFTQRKSSAKTLLGPLLKGKVNDQFHITFRNLASRPFNIYPNAAARDLRSIGVPPNGTFGYIWSLTTEDGPLEGDPQCLTQLYQSTISPERDLASGLVGTLLICKHGSGSDKDWNLIFAVFDENRSWYIDENLKNSNQISKSNNTDPEFYDSNVIYSVNGIMFSGRQFVICQTDVAYWHVANVGTQGDFLSVYFTGNLFRHQGIYQSVLTLFPMTAMTVAMETELENGTDTFASDYMDLRSGEIRYRYYYIAAEEVIWDYGIRKPHQLIKPREMRRGMRKFLPQYKKVVFRAYRDKDFRHPVTRGELQEHLGIMGPFIRAEINDLLTVIFKNKASRPFSFHLQGVYDRSQGAGIAQTYPVAPGEARTYNWRITIKQGPTDKQLDCKAGAYYSTVNKERDFHSGLIGPLVICKTGTLLTRLGTQPGVEEFALLFNTFDETKSWYLEENLQQYCAPPCHVNPEDPWYHITINGYVAETLPGLVVARHQQVRWHLLNVGSDGEYHAVHVHGLPFTDHTEEEHRMGVYKLFPEFTLYCVLPLGMKSGRIEDSQITASNHRGRTPHLARLEQSGYINAWMGQNKLSWLQVDLLKPTLLHGVQTQGVRAKLRENYITHFTVSYSLDQETWINYRGNSTRQTCIFYGNMDSSKVKENHFSPPFVARYIRIHPVNYERRPALRMELLGCDLNSCSLPLGLQKRQIPDDSLIASSSYSSLLRSWSPTLARLHQQGSANAWRPKNNNPHEWLQVDLGKVKRITGVVTQGAHSLLTQMMVTEFSVTVSHDGQSWSSVLEESSQREKIFTGNNDPDEEAVTLFDPPLFGQFLRIHPRGWINDIALRLEVLGCDTQQDLI
uniref:Coagulation factor VIII-like n=1 Tax=Sphaeramia orbicularis TaxID=375764 RepID=A0A672Z3S4_9TELE